MNRIVAILAVLLTTQGCVGPTPRQTGMVLLNMSLAVVVFVYLFYSGIDIILRWTGRAALQTNWRVGLLQVLIWVAVSGFISLNWYSHHAKENYWVTSTRPLNDWLGIQVLSIIYLPPVFLCAVIVQQVMRRSRIKGIVDYSLTGTMFIHYTWCLFLMAN